MSNETVRRSASRMVDPAVSWLCSRQEMHELYYWLTFVAYDPSDESFNNRVYLIYLVLFFGAWGFASLTLFAGGGEGLLRLLDRGNPTAAAMTLAMGVLTIWNLVRLYSVLRRSPVEFSEEDSYLLCQSPVSRRAVVLRWLWMPWIKNALPFWVLAVVLGFSLGEIMIPQIGITAHIGEYFGYGLHSWLALAPAHLALFGLHWAVGVLRIRLDAEHLRARAAWLFVMLIGLGLVLPLAVWQALPWFEQTGLVPGLGVGAVAATLSLAALVAAAGNFHLARAAEETRTHVLLNDALRYGLTGYAENLRAEQRLRGERPPTRLPVRAGPAALIWKDLLQAERGLRWGVLSGWLTLASAVFGAFALPTGGILLLLLTIWVVQVGKLSVVRLRSDLACWPIFCQLPISSRGKLIMDLVPALVGVVLVSLIAALGGLALRGALANAENSLLPIGSSGSTSGLLPSTVWLIPGTAAAAAGMAALEVMRRAQSALLLNGQVPEADFLGVLAGLVAAGVPGLAMALLPGAAGVGLGVGLSWLIGYLALLLAGRMRPA